VQNSLAIDGEPHQKMRQTRRYGAVERVDRAFPFRNDHKFNNKMQSLLVVTFLLGWRTSAWLTTCPSIATSQTFLSTKTLLATSFSEGEEERNGLVVAGECLLDVSKSAGEALIRAGRAWAMDWDEVTEELAEASQDFYKIAVKNSLYESIAQELEDASTIEGCTSVGPPSAVPNLIAIKEHLKEIAEEGGGDSVPARKAAEALHDLIETF
jgi:hypothetical protein